MQLFIFPIPLYSLQAACIFKGDRGSVELSMISLSPNFVPSISLTRTVSALGPENSTRWMDLEESRKMIKNSSVVNMGMPLSSASATAINGKTTLDRTADPNTAVAFSNSSLLEVSGVDDGISAINLVLVVIWWILSSVDTRKASVTIKEVNKQATSWNILGIMVSLT